MRELTVRIRFTTHCLGNVKERSTGRFLLPRAPDGRVIFLATWHQANMRFASKVLGRHQDEVERIYWDIHVDAALRADRWHRRYFTTDGRERYAQHEAFVPGQTIGINCVVPSAIDEDDFWTLLRLAGQYRGISPWQPGKHGYFEVEGIRPRRMKRGD